MEELDAGHRYKLNALDNGDEQTLQFLKRIGEGYPGNEPPGYGGTNCQEVLRALIKRTIYLDRQEPCSENLTILKNLRRALYCFEYRAARRHGRPFVPYIGNIEDWPTNPTDGHVYTPKEKIESEEKPDTTVETSEFEIADESSAGCAEVKTWKYKLIDSDGVILYFKTRKAVLGFSSFSGSPATVRIYEKVPRTIFGFKTKLHKWKEKDTVMFALESMPRGCHI